MTTYLLKTEPNEYSFADLLRDKRCTWDGVGNPQALQAIRAMRKDDEVLIYHTGDEKAVVGLARVVKGAYGDPASPGKTPEGLPKMAVVDLVPVRAARTPVSLAEIKADGRFDEFALVKQARLSAMAVPPELDSALREMAGL